MAITCHHIPFEEITKTPKYLCKYEGWKYESIQVIGNSVPSPWWYIAICIACTARTKNEAWYNIINCYQ